MIERYHLVLLGWCLLAGALGGLSVLRLSPPTRWVRHVVALLGLVGAVAGSAAGGWHRSAPWLVLAAVCAAVPDRDHPDHPLGRWTVLLAVVSLLGVWSAVPDTQAPLALAGVWAPLGAVWALSGRRTGPVASVALVGGIAGAAWVGSAGWGAALASVVAVGMLVAAPVAVAMRPAAATVGPLGARLVVLVSVHVAVALAAPRALMGRGVPVAASAALVLLALCVVVAGAVLARPVGRATDAGLRST